MKVTNLIELTYFVSGRGVIEYRGVLWGEGILVVLGIVHRCMLDRTREYDARAEHRNVLYSLETSVPWYTLSIPLSTALFRRGN